MCNVLLNCLRYYEYYLPFGDQQFQFDKQRNKLHMYCFRNSINNFSFKSKSSFVKDYLIFSISRAPIVF